jgi:hypothetical protein
VFPGRIPIFLGFCIICISGACTSSLSFIPALTHFPTLYEPFNPIKLVLADFSGLQERQSRICDKFIWCHFWSNENRQRWQWLQYHQLYPLQSPGEPFLTLGSARKSEKQIGSLCRNNQQGAGRAARPP